MALVRSAKDSEYSMSAINADETWQLLKASVDSYLAARHDRARMRRPQADTGAIRFALWREMAQLGWLSLTMPESMGGSGLPLRDAAALAELFGISLVPEPLVACGLMPATLLSACHVGSERDRLASWLVTGERCLSIAWQERTGEIEPQVPQTALDAAGLLTGQKLFVPLTFSDSMLLVSAIRGTETVIVMIAADAPGVNIKRQLMGDGGYSATIVFEQARVIEEPLAQGVLATRALQRALDAGTTAVAAALAGAASGALLLALEHLRTRTQFGRPIGEFQVLQHRAADLYVGVEQAKASWREAAACCERAPDAASNAIAISAAKSRCAKSALAVGKGAVQLFGALGYTEEADIGLFLRASLYWASWLGTESLHRRRFYNALRSARHA